MPQLDESADPRPGIRAVVAVGFFGGILTGFLVVVFTGFLQTVPWLEDPATILIFVGVALGVGILGTMCGALVGLFTRLALHGMHITASWWPAVLLSALTSACIGLAFVLIVLPMFAQVA